MASDLIISKHAVIISVIEKKILSQSISNRKKTFDLFDFQIFKNESKKTNNPNPELIQQL